MKNHVLGLRPGEVVEVRSEEEILATLDETGALEGLPFMSVMHEYCQRKFKVLRRADKILAEGIGMRRIRNTVILEGTTCNGEAQGGCRRTCFILWKEAWLKRIRGKNRKNQTTRVRATEMSTSIDSSNKKTFHPTSFTCQSRSIVDASSPLSRWDLRRYMWNLTSGVYRPLEYLQTILISFSTRVHKLLNQPKDTKLTGRLRRTPTKSLDLQPGDLVKVKSKEEILQTLDYKGRNRGLEFTFEMEKHCGKKFRILKQLDKMIVEQTGAMRQISNTVLLEGAFCDGKAHRACPRNCYCLWREIWLQKIQTPGLSKPNEVNLEHKPVIPMYK